MNKTSINQKVKDMKPEVGFICYSIAIQKKKQKTKKQQTLILSFYFTFSKVLFSLIST